MRKAATARSLWVTMTSVMPWSRLSSISSACTSSPVAGIEVAGRLVGEDGPRRQHDGARDRHPLLLAAGQLTRLVRQALGEADPLEDGARLRARPRRRSCRRSAPAS